MSFETPLAETLEWLFRTPPPAAVERKARELMLDTLGCVLAARRHPEVAAFEKTLQEADPGSTSSAAAFFAAAACWDEACEGLARAHGRPGLAVLAACSALSQVRSCSLRDTLCAYVTGYEVGGRFGESLRVAPGMHVDGAWPCFGVAAAVVQLLGGNAMQALAAVRIAACQMPCSLYLPVARGANARNTYPSHAAQLGMLAAAAAMAGITAPDGAVEELRARMLAGAPPGPAFARPGEWLIAEAYTKPFAAVRHVHYGVTAALALRPQVADRLKDISRIRLSTYAEALAYCSNRAPASLLQAQFSLSYGVACALVTGDLGPESYDLHSRAIQELEALIDLEEDAQMTHRGARLSIELNETTLSETVDRVAGDPSLPMTRAEILAKFARYAGRDGAAFLDAPGESRFPDVSPL